MEVDPKAGSGKGNTILWLEDHPAATSDHRGGGLHQWSNDFGFPFTKLFFSALGKDLRNGKFCGLDDPFVGIDERHGESFGEKGSDRALA